MFYRIVFSQRRDGGYVAQECHALPQSYDWFQAVDYARFYVRYRFGADRSVWDFKLIRQPESCRKPAYVAQFVRLSLLPDFPIADGCVVVV